MPATMTQTQKANAMKLAIAGWNAGIRDYAGLTQYVIDGIVSIEHRPPTDSSVIARARWATAVIIAAKSPDGYPSGGVVNTIGGTISAAGGNPIVQGVKGAIEAPITVAEFLAKLANPWLWVRIAEVAGGAGLVFVGVRMLAQQSGTPLPSIPLPKVSLK